MKVSAVIPTRGNVDMAPIVESLACFDEVIVWDNSAEAKDLKVYGRFAAIERAKHEIIWTQDDDVIVEDPAELVRLYSKLDVHLLSRSYIRTHFIVANMPARFREHYPDSCLLGFGSVFHRSTPDVMLAKFSDTVNLGIVASHPDSTSWFQRTCDVIVTTLATERVLVETPIEILDYAHGDDRMWRQPGHVGERQQMLELARRVRDAG